MGAIPKTFSISVNAFGAVVIELHDSMQMQARFILWILVVDDQAQLKYNYLTNISNKLNHKSWNFP